MGKRKYRIALICLGILLLQTSCIFHKKINISSVSLVDEKISIILNCNNFIPNINEVIIENEDEYIIFEKECINEKITKKQKTVELNCANKKIKTNQEYVFYLRFSGGYAIAKIFIGNPLKKIPEIFPCKNYEEIQVIILDESFAIGI